MKKNIFGYCSLLVLFATLFACSDDETGNSYLRENTVQVIKSNLFFNADAQKGGVKFSAPAGTTAYITEPWATAELMGDSITVSVTSNKANDSRSAVLTIKNGADSTNISILQKGCEFEYLGEKIYVINDEATTLELPIHKVGAEPSLRLSETDDATVLTKIETQSDKFIVHLSANTTGEPRSIGLLLENAEQAETISVIQGQLSDFLNKPYGILGYNMMKINDNILVEEQLLDQIEGTIKANSDGTIYFESGQLKIPLEFDPSTLAFTLRGGQLYGEQTKDGSRNAFVGAIWDATFYNSFLAFVKNLDQLHNKGTLSDSDYNQLTTKVVPSIFTSFASDKLTMSTIMMPANLEGSKVLMGPFVDTGTNLSYIKGLTSLTTLGFPLDEFMASTWAIYDYKITNKSLVLKNPIRINSNYQFNGSVIMFVTPILYHIISGEGTSTEQARVAKAYIQRTRALLSTMKRSPALSWRKVK